MGLKLPAGSHTRTPTSPGGNSRQETADEYGTSHNGVWYSWDAQQGLYRARIPPPLGPWMFLVFDAGDDYSLYEQVPEGTDVWVERGQDVWNGP